ncbi:MAG: Translation initiation factor 2, partial [Pseudomonadota bacterium]
MSANNVANFAAELKMPADVLLQQLKAAGVAKQSVDDLISESDKEHLLNALRRAHGSDEAPKKKITLTRKQTSEIKQADATGKARTIQVEVRKKRVFVKRDAPEAQEVAPPAPQDLTPEEDAARLEEEQRQQELLERQAAELREKQERLEREREREVQAAAEAAAREEAARRERERLAALEFAQKEEDKARAQAETAAALEEARRAKEAAEAQARARRAVESEVAEINRLMSLQRKPVPKPAPKPPEPEVKPVEAPKKEGPSGTLHKPTAQKAAESKEVAAVAKPKEKDSKDPKDAKDKKHLKSEKLSSSWADEASKRRALKTRGDTSMGNNSWR